VLSAISIVLTIGLVVLLACETLDLLGRFHLIKKQIQKRMQKLL
jgi:hypothetical protein